MTALFYAFPVQFQGWDSNCFYANIAFDRLDHFIRYMPAVSIRPDELIEKNPRVMSPNSRHKATPIKMASIHNSVFFRLSYQRIVFDGSSTLSELRRLASSKRLGRSNIGVGADLRVGPWPRKFARPGAPHAGLPLRYAPNIGSRETVPVFIGPRPLQDCWR